LAAGQKSLAYMGITIWESLNPNLKVQPFYSFKKIQIIPPKTILTFVIIHSHGCYKPYLNFIKM